MDQQEEINGLKARIKDLEKKIFYASICLADWDGYYNPETNNGNVKELAKLIEEVYCILQNGKSWRDTKEDATK